MLAAPLAPAPHPTLRHRTLSPCACCGSAGGDIAASGGKADPNDAVFISEADWRAILDNNLSSTIMVSQAVSKHMIEKELPGRIVTVSSDAAYLANDHGSQAIYATSKAAVNHYSKALAQQLR